MMKASSWPGCRCNGGILGTTTSPAAIASTGLTTPIPLCCHCCHHHCLALIVFVAVWCHRRCLASTSLFGIIVTIVAIIAIVAIVAIIAIITIALFAPVAIAPAAIVVTLTLVTTTVLAIAAALVPS